MPSTQDVDVDVRHALHGIWAGVHNQTVAALGDTFLLGNQPRRPQQPPGDLVVPVLQVVGRRDVLIRHDQHVDWRPRLDVSEGGYLIILVDDRGGDSSSDDAAKETFVHVISPSIVSPTRRCRRTGVIWPSCSMPEATTRR